MRSSVLAAFYLVGYVAAGVIHDAGIVVRRSTVEQEMEYLVGEIAAPVQRRQEQGILTVEEWDAAAQAACTTNLLALNGVASNPSGLAACYNLPKFDNITGVFGADLRIYKISEPTGGFVGIPTNSIQVGLSYIGATVSPIDTSTLRRRDGEKLVSWSKRQAANMPQLTKEFAFVGQINADVIRANQGTADLQKVLVPQVTLNGVDSTGNRVNTTLSSQEATFVAGVFAAQAAPTPVAQDKPLQTLVTLPDQPFIIPGMNILIFPIGGIITGIWAIFFCGTIAYGTFGRYQFRDDFRRRKARAGKGGFETI